MHCGDQRHLGLCPGYVPALAYGTCRVSDQGTTLRASDLHNARATILNPFCKILRNMRSKFNMRVVRSMQATPALRWCRFQYWIFYPVLKHLSVGVNVFISIVTNILIWCFNWRSAIACLIKFLDVILTVSCLCWFYWSFTCTLSEMTNKRCPINLINSNKLGKVINQGNWVVSPITELCY